MEPAFASSMVFLFSLGLLLQPLLGFLDKLFPALWAGDGDLAFSSGNPHHLAAPGTIIIAVLPILDPVHQLQIFPVFLIALVGIPGEAAENGQKHKTISQ